MTLLQPFALALAALPTGDSGDGWITLESELTRLAEEAAPAAEDDGGWDFVIRPYVWFPNFQGDVGVGTIPPVTVSKDFFEDTQPGVILGLDAMPGGRSWGLMFELVYLQLDAANAGNESTIEQAYLDTHAFWRLPDLGETDVYVGLRWWNLDVSLETPTDPPESATANFVDPVFGARTAIPIGEKWRFRARGDVGGLGLGTNLTWGGSLGIARKIAEKGEVDFGWRFLDLTYDDEFDVEGEFSGLILGLIWGF